MMPRSRVVQTSQEAAGQIYVPLVNWMLLAAAVVLVLMFQSSDRLASTYGISVSTAMVVTTVLAFFVARERGHWPLGAALLFLAVFLMIDGAYFASNLLQVPHGGVFVLAIPNVVSSVVLYLIAIAAGTAATTTALFFLKKPIETKAPAPVSA